MREITCSLDRALLWPFFSGTRRVGAAEAGSEREGETEREV